MNAVERKKLIKQIEALANRHDAKSWAWEHNGRKEKINVEFAKVSVVLYMDAIDTSQHWWGATEDLNPMVFGINAVNPYHHRKATVVRYTGDILNSLEHMFHAVGNNTAFIPAKSDEA